MKNSGNGGLHILLMYLTLTDAHWLCTLPQ